MKSQETKENESKMTAAIQQNLHLTLIVATFSRQNQ